jgi:transcriptional antiterminator NusG
MIFVIKVTTNKEDKAMEMISDKVRKKALAVYSLVRPHGLRGYIFLEALDRETAEESAFNLPYVKGIIGKTLEYAEIKNMLTPNLEEVKIEKGDIVEIIGEPFKKEKAKVTRVDKQKGEVIVSLLNAVVPIPVTVKIDNVRVLRTAEDAETENKSQEKAEQKEKKEKQSLVPSDNENYLSNIEEDLSGMYS